MCVIYYFIINCPIHSALIKMDDYSFNSYIIYEEFHRKTRYIHFGQFEIFEI